jgi:hypothetical protein
MTGGAGGALLAIGAEAAARLDRLPTPEGNRRGLGELAAAGAQWALGRPAAYGVPAALPWLQLGEMVYHPAHEPLPLAASAAAMVAAAMGEVDAAAARRRARAAALLAGVPPAVGRITTLSGGESGMLRLPVLLTTPAPPARLGVVPGYPRTLAEQAELRPLLRDGEGEHPGARTLRRLLHTVPVHDFVTARDLERLTMWLQSCDSNH